MMRFVTRIMIGCRRHDETRRATPILDVPAAGSGNSTSGRLFFLPFKELTEQHFSILGLRKARRAGLVLAQELFEHAPNVGARHSNAFGGRGYCRRMRPRTAPVCDSARCWAPSCRRQAPLALRSCRPVRPAR